MPAAWISLCSRRSFQWKSPSVCGLYPWTVVTFVLACQALPSAWASAPTRFWIDQYAFGEGETFLLKSAIQASSWAQISGETRSKFLAVKGHQAPSEWDIYWTAHQGCERALLHAKPGQRVSCVPGMEAVTEKRQLAATMVAAYGEGAFAVIPRTYLLPEEYWRWRLAIQSQASQAKQPFWVLKASTHRGTGVQVLPEDEAIAAARAIEAKGHRAQRTLVQAYIPNQLLVNRQPFYMRLWVVVTSVTPLRVYLFNGGFLVFGAKRSKPSPFDLNKTEESRAGS
ncbi:hypothetical protein WJX84_007461 [Apatococcus fuscideae]|uniref:Tubulin--tyrosine ligase-like protein 5 n=1 Tax=Apatococcus fuscideae TaxID=2026836 RepID=A0AAW1T7N9_9CHLO